MLTKNTPKRSNERRAKLDADPTVSSTKNFVVELGNDLQTSIKDGSMANTSHLLDRLCDLVITAKHTEKVFFLALPYS